MRHPIVCVAAVVTVLGVAAGLRSEIIPIDNFDIPIEDLPGWTLADLSAGQPWGPGIYDPSSGALRICHGGNELVPPGAPFTETAMFALWDDSTDPLFSNGFLRAKIRTDEVQNSTSLEMRADLSTGTAYVLFGSTKPPSSMPPQMYVQSRPDRFGAADPTSPMPPQMYVQRKPDRFGAADPNSPMPPQMHLHSRPEPPGTTKPPTLRPQLNGMFGMSKFVNGVETQIWRSGIEYLPGEEWSVEAGAVGSQISAKVWRVGESEPTAPQFVWTDPDPITSGQIGISSDKTLGNTIPAYADATFDDIVFHAVPEPAAVALIVLCFVGLIAFRKMA